MKIELPIKLNRKRNELNKELTLIWLLHALGKHDPNKDACVFKTEKKMHLFLETWWKCIACLADNRICLHCLWHPWFAVDFFQNSEWYIPGMLETKVVVTKMFLLFTRSWRIIPNAACHSDSYKENHANIVCQDTHKNQRRSSYIQTNTWSERAGGQIFSEFSVNNAFDPLSYRMASEDLTSCTQVIWTLCPFWSSQSLLLYDKTKAFKKI